MSKFTKIAAATLAALTITAVVSVSSTEAQAKHGWGPAGIGLAAGAIIGAAAASSAYGYHPYYYGGPVYVSGPGYVRCHWERRYNAWGHYVGKRRICTAY